MGTTGHPPDYSDKASGTEPSRHSPDALTSVCDLQISAPSARDESRLFDLISRIDHKVIQGYSFYIQIHGTAYKVLYGVYWRSVYSDEQFWGLHCEEIERGMWAETDSNTARIDLPIRYTDGSWTVEEQSLQFLLNQDMPLFDYAAPYL